MTRDTIQLLPDDAYKLPPGYAVRTVSDSDSTLYQFVWRHCRGACFESRLYSYHHDCIEKAWDDHRERKAVNATTMQPGIPVVVCGVLLDERDVLVQHRRRDQTFSGQLVFPGGKVEVDRRGRWAESFFQACLRELEEVGAQFFQKSKTKQRLLCRSVGRVDPKNTDSQFLLLTYLFKKIDYNFRYNCSSGREGQLVRWININELRLKAFAPANIPAVKALKNEYWL